MTWARYDDIFDEIGEVRAAWRENPAAVGLHLLATTACNRTLTDGVIDPEWLATKLPRPREREKVLAAGIKHDLFFAIPAGSTAVLIDEADNEITVGPFPETRYVVREFLRWHPSSIMVKARRAADANRKRKTRKGSASGRTTPDVRPDSERTPSGHTPDVQPDSDRTPRGGARGSAPEQAPVPEPAGASRPDPTRPDLPSPQPPQAGEHHSPRGTRASGTNPRALAAVAAAAHVTDPDAGQLKAGEQVIELVRQTATDTAREMWLSSLHVAGVDQAGTLLLSADDEQRSYVANRWGRLVVELAARNQTPARMVTTDEAAGLTARQPRGVAA